MKFFVPGAETEEEAKNIYEATVKFATDNVGPVANRRIQSITFDDHGKRRVTAEVGKIEPIEGETVVAILDSITYLICTPNRGVIRGTPILVGKGEVRSVTEFDAQIE